MRTSLNNIQLAEGYLQGQLPAGDALLFEARLLLDEELRNNVAAQTETYGLVHQYGRKQLRAEIEEVHKTLFKTHANSSFAQRMLNIFR